MDKGWLALIAIVVLVAAVFAGVKWKDHRDQAQLEAEVYCTMDSAIPNIYSPEFKNCVDQYLD